MKNDTSIIVFMAVVNSARVFCSTREIHINGVVQYQIDTFDLLMTLGHNRFEKFSTNINELEHSIIAEAQRRGQLKNSIEEDRQQSDRKVFDHVIHRLYHTQIPIVFRKALLAQTKHVKSKPYKVYSN